MCKRVLLVDDEYLIRFTLANTLQAENVEIVGVPSAEEALRELEVRAFDLCFLDVKLPGMSGLEALDHIREQSPATRVVLMSGHAAAESCGRRAGAVAFLEKPFSLCRLKELAARLLEESPPSAGRPKG